MSDQEPAVRQVAVAVILRAGRVLVQTRAGGGPWNGYWEFPGGGVEAGESGAQAARRECIEEVGLAVETIESIECQSWHDKERAVAVEFFLCAAIGDDEARPLLGQQLSWVGPDELNSWTFLPANASVLAWLVRLLNDPSSQP